VLLDKRKQKDNLVPPTSADMMLLLPECKHLLGPPHHSSFKSGNSYTDTNVLLVSISIPLNYLSLLLTCYVRAMTGDHLKQYMRPNLYQEHSILQNSSK
jgi:hypothetical protein